MFKRDIKRGFDEAKYKYLAERPGKQNIYQRFWASHKSVVACAGAIMVAFSVTKRYYQMGHAAHKDMSKPMLMPNGELHPYEHQPRSAAGIKVYS